MIAAALLLLTGAAPDLLGPYRALVEVPPDAQLKAQALEHQHLPAYQFWTVGGWAASGHRALPVVAFAVQGRATIWVVRADTENVDAEGYHQRMTGLWLCPLAQANDAANRAKQCTSLFALVEERLTKAFAEKQPPAWFDGVSELLGLLAGEHRRVKMLRKQSELEGPLSKLFAPADSGVPHDAAWVKGSMGFAPWVTMTAGARFAGLGMAVDDEGGLELLEVHFEPRYGRVRQLDGGTEPPDSQNHLSVSRKSVAFTRRFIE